jgi:ADP-ribose pyrophosphatase YjhB (NUDIX family)
LITCAIRETKEETSLELDKDSLRIVGWREHFRFNQHYFMCYVHAPKWSGEVQNTEPDRCCGWAWHSIMHIQSETTTEPMDILLSLFERPVDNLRTQIDELMLKLNRENTKTFELKALLRKTIVFMDHTAECDIESLKNKGLLLPPSCSCGLVSLAKQIDQATK